MVRVKPLNSHLRDEINQAYFFLTETPIEKNILTLDYLAINDSNLEFPRPFQFLFTDFDQEES